LLIAPAYSVADTVRLHDILHQLEQASPQLVASRADANAANAGVAIAESQYWGRADIFGRDTHYNNARLVNPISPPLNFATMAIDKNQFAYGTTFTLPIDINGRITADVRAQEHFSQAANHGVESSRLNLFAQAVSLYRALQQITGTQLALSSQQQALIKHYDITQTAIRVGRTARVELFRIDAEIKAVEGRVAALDGDEARVRANLAALLNQQQFTTAVLVPEKTPAGLSMPERKLLQDRPDMMSSNSQILAANERLEGARREWLPSFSVQATTMRNQGYSAIGDNTWSVTGQLTWEIWDGGRRFAHADQAYARKEAARQQHLLIHNRARAEFDATRAAWKAANLQYQAAQAGLKAAIETEKIQANRYRNGRLSSVDLLDAEAVLAQARSNLSSALAGWWLADDQLNLAAGRAPRAYDQETGS
jgi:outer membrane protein TolC